MMHKKAIELSLNFIITIIISIVLFGFGIKFISDLSSRAKDITDVTNSELDRRIGSLICEGSDRVCVGADRKTIKKADFDVFGLKVINILDSQSFDITISPADPMGYQKDKTPITNPPSPQLVIKHTPSVRIEKNEEVNLGIGVQVPANAVSGTYILNVVIQAQDGSRYSSVQKLYVDVS